MLRRAGGIASYKSPLVARGAVGRVGSRPGRGDLFRDVMDASLVVSVVAAGIAGASALFAFRSDREARKSNDIAVLDFLREYRESETSRCYVFRQLASQN